MTDLTVAIPVLNDSEAIGPCLRSVLGQRSQVSSVTEILVIDGGSSDGTRAVVTALAEQDDRIHLLDNPDRHVPSAMNIAISRMATDILVRVDSHTVVADDYCDAAVAVLEESGADVVGGHMRPEATTEFGDAVAWALTSRWGIGGSSFHDVNREGPAQTVYMGVFRRSVFDRFGGFDERFTRNQDDELAYRINEMGGHIWLTPRLRSRYEPRGTRQGLFRQFRGYGGYKPMVLVLHPGQMRARHLAPPLAALAWLLLPFGLRWRAALVPPLAHAVAISVAAGGRGPGRWRDRATSLLVMHLAYGLGFWQGIPRGFRTAGGGSRPGGSGAAAAPRARR